MTSPDNYSPAAQNYIHEFSALGLPAGQVIEAHDANGSHPMIEIKVGSPRQALELIHKLVLIRKQAGLEKEDLTFFDNPAEGIEPNGSIFINPKNIADYDGKHGAGALMNNFVRERDQIHQAVGEVARHSPTKRMENPLLEFIGQLLKAAGLEGGISPTEVQAGAAAVMPNPHSDQGPRQQV